jgi:hypothetical protein
MLLPRCRRPKFHLLLLLPLLLPLLLLLLLLPGPR